MCTTRSEDPQVTISPSGDQDGRSRLRSEPCWLVWLCVKTGWEEGGRERELTA